MEAGAEGDAFQEGGTLVGGAQVGDIVEEGVCQVVGECLHDGVQGLLVETDLTVIHRFIRAVAFPQEFQDRFHTTEATPLLAVLQVFIER